MFFIKLPQCIAVRTHTHTLLQIYHDLLLLQRWHSWELKAKKDREEDRLSVDFCLSLLSSKPKPPVWPQLCSRPPTVTSTCSLTLSLNDHPDLLLQPSSCCPSSQLHQEFPGKPSAKSARETSRPAKQGGKLQLFTLPPFFCIQTLISTLAL